MWYTNNSHEHNPNRNPIKNFLYINRAKGLLNPDKMGEFRELLTECTNKDLDRDTELRLALDCLELMSLGVTKEEAADIFCKDVNLEIQAERISPVQGCMARDIIIEYGPKDLDFNSCLPKDSFLHVRNSYTNTKK